MELLSGPADAVLSIGTRKSILAKAQAEQVATLLENTWPETLKGNIALKGLVPLGDRDKTTALWDFSTAEAPASQDQPTGGEKAEGSKGGEKVVPPLGRQSDAKGLWTNELEDELERGGVDLIVHSLKDMPTTVPTPFLLGAITAREDPRDVVVMHPDLIAHLQKKHSALSTPTADGDEDNDGSAGAPYVPSLADIPAGFIIGTSSLRRTAQLRRLFPHLKFEPLRGNVPTRLAKLDESVLEGIPSAGADQSADPEGGSRSSTESSSATTTTTTGSSGRTPVIKDADSDQLSKAHPPFAAAILAAAGIHRLGLTHRITSYLLPDEPSSSTTTSSSPSSPSSSSSSPTPLSQTGSILYAVGQGALGLEIRATDDRVRKLIEPIICPKTMLACTAERAMLRTLEGGCSVPVGTRTTWRASDPTARSTEAVPLTLTLEGVVVNVTGEKSVSATGEAVFDFLPAVPTAASLSSQKEGEGEGEEGTYLPFLTHGKMAELVQACEQLGREVARKLVARGADEILEEIKGARK